jgi:acyl-CoA synthetase (AMP-forming)/AMP-acid ligase II
VEPIVRAVTLVEDCAYIGTRDRLKKPVTALVVVRKPQAQLTEKQLMEFLAKKIVRDRLPTNIFFIDAMPKTVSGAINRGKLRSQFDGM